MTAPHQHPLLRNTDDAWWRAEPRPSSASPQPVAPAGTESKWPFRMLLAFTFILLLAPQQAYPVLQPLRLAMLVAVGSVLTWTYASLARGTKFFELKPGIKPALVLVAWAIFTVPLSYWPGGSVALLLEEYFKTLILFLLLAHVIDTTEKLRKLALALVLIAMPLAMTALHSFATGGFSQNAGRVLVIYDAPLTANPNDMALMMNLLLPFAIGLFLSTKGRPLLRTALGMAVCIFVATIIITFSRAGFLALAVTFISYMWRLRRRPERGWIPMALVLMVAALPLVPSSYYDRLSTITNIEADASLSAQNRMSDMLVATQLMVNNPIVGAGVGMNVYAMNLARGETSLEIHNVYLQYGVDLGLPGLLLFLAVFASCMRSAQAVLERAAPLPDPNGLFYLAEAIKVSLMAFAVEAFFHPVAYNFYFYYIAGLAVALRTICDREEGLS
jgi:probable O-glycosylation ligase (exosortase A-associated)